MTLSTPLEKAGFGSLPEALQLSKNVVKLSTASSHGPNTIASARATYQNVPTDSARPVALQEDCIHDTTRRSKSRLQTDARNPTQSLATVQKEEVITARVYLEETVSEMSLERKDKQLGEKHIDSTRFQ